MLPFLAPLLAAALAAPLSEPADMIALALGVLLVSTVVLLALSVQQLRMLNARRMADAERDEQLLQALAAELQRLERKVVAHRNESATFLEAIFAGVQGLARNLDAARSATVQTLEEVRQKVPAPGEGQARAFDTQPDLKPPQPELLRGEKGRLRRA